MTWRGLPQDAKDKEEACYGIVQDITKLIEVQDEEVMRHLNDSSLIVAASHLVCSGPTL